MSVSVDLKYSRNLVKVQVEQGQSTSYYGPFANTAEAKKALEDRGWQKSSSVGDYESPKGGAYRMIASIQCFYSHNGPEALPSCKE